ncbi:nitroreductase family deazaflavin-dependent oxidoreductase [Spongiibacter sp. KMU-158]|uniref:Nitroreductase family deazaflavin-dependent oxidoreductase n=2 Tax=Spongiibacter pelagi TaxID=2760804 RepID=A0A927BYH8_9GAMM|nr:nitroreductase family deazaflavin-dependent oxidoreductase [Spongiibacter pelagi]
MVQPILRWATKLNIWVFKASGGRLMKTFLGKAPICVVTTTGAKTGKKREIALIDINWGDNKILVASKGGMSKHPVWYYNVKANPLVEILAEGGRRTYQARLATPEEKKEVWPVLVGVYEDFDEYQARTDRDIPVFICEPLA